MASELVVLRGRVHLVEFEYEPATGDGVHEEYIPESYTIVDITRPLALDSERGVSDFSTAELIEAIKRVGSDL